MVVVLESENQLTDILASAGDKLVIVDFWAQWCGPCKVIGPEFERLSGDSKYKDKVIFVKIDVDDFSDMAEEAGIEMMPTFIFFKNNTKVDTMAGANKALLREYIDKYLPS